jgi:hypothetical protein
MLKTSAEPYGLTNALRVIVLLELVLNVNAELMPGVATDACDI